MNAATSRVQARIDQAAVDKLSRFFDGREDTILNELFQNSRRAGATKIEIWTSEDEMTVTDDGEGIADPQRILDFGLSSWENQKIAGEDPGGMGLFSLARCGCRISSRPAPSADGAQKPGWTVTLEPKHFRGETYAVVNECEDAPEPSGTRINIRRKNKPELVRAAHGAGRYSPVKITINGEPIDQQDFLANAAHIKRWEGARIGVSDTWRDTEINFHGTVIIEDLPKVRTVKTVYQASVDIDDACGLELELPARRRAIENEWLKRLRQEALRTIYHTIGTVQNPQVPYKVHEDAGQMGIELPTAAPILQDWKARPAHWTPTIWDCGQKADASSSLSHVKAYGLRMDGVKRLPASDQIAVERAFKQAAKRQEWNRPLYEPIPEYEGYRWYDAIEQVEEVRTRVEFGNLRYEIKNGDEIRGQVPDGRPDTITLLVKTVNANGQKRTCEIPTEIAFGNSSKYNDDPEDAEILITKEAAIGAEEVANLNKAAFFQPSTNWTSDSLETQELDFTERALFNAMGLVESNEEAVRHELQQGVEHHIARRLPGDWRANIEISCGTSAHERVKIRVWPPAKPGEKAN